MLQKQLVHLNMSGGLQKKDDQFLVIPSKLAVADNVQFDDASTVVRRGGQSSVSLTPLGPFGSLTAGQLVRGFTHNGVAHTEGISTSVFPGGIRRVQKSGGTVPVVNPSKVDGHAQPYHFRRAGAVTARVGSAARKSTSSVTAPLAAGSYDCAVLGNLTCYVWESSDPEGSGRIIVRFKMIDEETGFVMYEGYLDDSTNQLVKPRVVASVAQSKFFIYVASFAAASTSCVIKQFSLSSVGAITSLTTVATQTLTGNVESAVGSEALFDVVYSSDALKLALIARTGTDLQGYDIDVTDGTTATSLGTFNTSTAPTTLTALITNDGTDYRLHALYGILTNVAKGMAYDYTATTFSAETTIGTGAVSSVVGRIVAYENSTKQVYIAFDVSSSVTSDTTANTDRMLRLSRCAHDYSSLTECAGMPAWSIAGRIGVMSSRLFLPLVYLSSTYDGAVFVTDLTEALGNLGVAGATGTPMHVIARVDPGECAMFRENIRWTMRVPNMPVRSSTFVLPYLKYETDLRLAGNTNDTEYALARVTVNFDSQLQHEEINGLTFLAGACPHTFDGSNYVEEGFHHAPYLVDAGTPAATGTYEFPNDTATYTVCFTEGWQDNQGNWWESAPSAEATVSITAGSGFYSITPVLVRPPSMKTNSRVLFYRTKGSSTDTSLYLAVTNDGTSITSDSTLGNGEQLYTAGGVLPNTPAPSCRHVSTFQKRLVLSGCGDGSRVHWSKVTTPGYGVEFSSGDPSHQQTVPADKGRVVGTEELDNNLIVLCENGVGIVGGSGPASTGTQGQYSDFATIISETGASWDSPKSIIRGPEGVWFRSPFGIRLVSRSGGLGLAPDGKQAGAEVDSLVSGNLVAVVGDAKQQVRFYQSSGTVLIWDYQWKQWTRFTGHANVDAVYADDRYYHLSNYSTTTPLLRYTDETAYTDVNDSGTASSDFTGYVETAWLSFAGIQGFQRVYRLMVLGRNVDSSVQTQTFAGAIGYDFDVTSPPTGETFPAVVTPAANGVVQFQHHFAKQKCEAMKIGLSFKPTTSNTGRFRLTDLTLQVGVKVGYNKLPASSRY